MRNKALEVDGSAIVDLRNGLLEIHAKTGSWRLAGIPIRSSGAYARLLAMGERQPSKKVLDQWQRWHVPSSRTAYFRPCLARDAAARIPQLEALLAAARREAMDAA